MSTVYVPLALLATPYDMYYTCSTAPERLTLAPYSPACHTLLRYLFIMKLQDVDYPKLLDLRNNLLLQINNRDRKAEIIRLVNSIFPEVNFQEPITFTAVYLCLVHNRLVCLLYAYPDWKEDQLKVEANSGQKAKFNPLTWVMNVIPNLLATLRAWLDGMLADNLTQVCAEESDSEQDTEDEF